MTKLKSNVVKVGGRVTKKVATQNYYDNEMMVYKKRLSYTPKLISHNDKKNEITISYECCVPFTKIPKREKEFYYPQIKKLFYRFKKDTGYYHGDFAPKNIMVNPETKKVKLIDFGILQKDFDKIIKVGKVRRMNVENLIRSVGIMRR